MPVETALRVPFALTAQGEEIRPEQAAKGTSYICPSCRAEVRLRDGATKRRHFFHVVETDHCDFLNETESHLRAKWALVAAVERLRPLQFLRTCSHCHRPGTQDLPASVTKAELEYVLPSGRRADVALLDDSGQLRAVLEVLCMHAVDADKSRDLEGLRWAEVKAEDVLSGDPLPLQQDHFAPFICQRCRQVQRFGATFAFTGPHKQQVECPIPGRPFVNVIDMCAPCPHFVTVKDRAILCVGRSDQRGGS